MTWGNWLVFGVERLADNWIELTVAAALALASLVLVHALRGGWGAISRDWRNHNDGSPQ